MPLINSEIVWVSRKSAEDRSLLSLKVLSYLCIAAYCLVFCLPLKVTEYQKPCHIYATFFIIKQ
jgi:hypothetical protein